MPEPDDVLDPAQLGGLRGAEHAAAVHRGGGVRVEAQQAAYVETAIEDNEICERLDRGRRALYEQGLDDAGPYQSPMEDAEVHFHEWLHRKLGK